MLNFKYDLSSTIAETKLSGPEIKIFNLCINYQKQISFFEDYKIKCAIGKRGIGIKKKRGLNNSKGSYKIKSIFFRPDKIKTCTQN